jgi:hypothetical protein
VTNPESIQRELTATLERNRTNTNLSGEARQRLAASAYLKAQEKMAGIKASGQRSTAQSRAALERKLFGLPAGADSSAVISYRDAVDRAARVESAADATAMLKRAAISGDQLLAKAVLGRAFEGGWVGVVDSYVESQPDSAGPIDQLIELNDNEARASTHAARFAESLFSSVPRPEELKNVNDFAVEQMAGQAPPAHEIPAPPAPVPVSSGLTGGTYRLTGDDQPNQ